MVVDAFFCWHVQTQNSICALMANRWCEQTLSGHQSERTHNTPLENAEGSHGQNGEMRNKVLDDAIMTIDTFYSIILHWHLDFCKSICPEPKWTFHVGKPQQSSWFVLSSNWQYPLDVYLERKCLPVHLTINDVYLIINILIYMRKKHFANVHTRLLLSH